MGQRGLAGKDRRHRPGRGPGGICFLLAKVPSILPPAEMKMVLAS